MIILTALGRSARCTTDEPLTAGSVGLTVQYVFDAAWDGLQKIATFAAGAVSADVALSGDGRCAVPPQCLAEPGANLTVGVRGARADGTVVIPTVIATAGRIVPGAVPAGVDPAEPAPDWTAQVQAALEHALDALEAETGRAAQSATDAAASAGAAQQSASEAAASAGAAQQSVTEAAASAGAAQQSATEAAASAGAAQQSAEEARGRTVTLTAPTTLTLTDNTLYVLTDVSNLTLTYPASGHWLCHIILTTAASGTVTVTLPAIRYIGTVPVFETDETWEISILDGVVIAEKAEAPPPSILDGARLDGFVLG